MTTMKPASLGAAALTLARSAVEHAPGDPSARYALAEQLEAAGERAAALVHLRQAVAIDARFGAAWNYLGILLGESGDDAGAAAAFKSTVQLDPQRATAWNNLGNAQRSLGRLGEAQASFARALAVRPDYPLAAANLASAQRDLGDVIAAEATARAALAWTKGKPPFRPLLVILAGLVRENGGFDESAELYRRAIEAAPAQSGNEWISLARVHSERGENDRAREAYAHSLAVDRGDLRASFGLHLTLPMIYADAQALTTAREIYRQGLATLHRDFEAIVGPMSATQVLDGLRWTNFFLAYHGEIDRDLQQGYADFAARAIDRVEPRWRAPMPAPPRRARVRVGFASAYFHVGTVGRYFCHWITGLDRDRFEVYVYHLFPGMDDVASAINERADVFRVYGGMRARPTVVAPDIRADELDLLIYPELGMDATTFGLAALRLAPLQYAAWGHPVTTGHATIDGFFTCAAMEPEGYAAHYSERQIIPLPGIGTRYLRPTIPVEARRADLGLPSGCPLLLCPQSLFKIHPDNDGLFARVLAAIPEARLVLFAGRHPAITDQYMRRFSRACDRHGVAIRERTRVLPLLSHQDFLRVNRVCDAMLDTRHWSGGNTSLDALACALPIVTLPGATMRARQSMGMLSVIDLPELIARDEADYVRIVARLAVEPAWRAELVGRIKAGQAKLFDVPDAIDRLQDFLEDAARRLPVNGGNRRPESFPPQTFGGT
ncbi:MAG: tetratricopeptide repeat protein [Betaproteobacteria bacterium]